MTLGDQIAFLELQLRFRDRYPENIEEFTKCIETLQEKDSIQLCISGPNLDRTVCTRKKLFLASDEPPEAWRRSLSY